MPLGRRTALSCGVLLVAGCTSLTDPVIHDSRGAQPPLGPDQGVELMMASLMAHRQAVAASSAPAGWKQAVVQMLQAHAVAVTHPLDPSPGPVVELTGGTGRALELTASADDLAARQESLMLSASDPSMVLLWASLAAATRLTRRPGPLPVAGPRPQRATIGTEAEARNTKLGHLQSLNLALDIQRGAADKAQEALLAVRQREVTSRIRAEQRTIRALGADPVGPLPGYQWPGPVTAVATLEVIERQIAQACGPVVAASAEPRRRAALEELVTQTRGAHASGGIPFFPGWA